MNKKVREVIAKELILVAKDLVATKELTAYTSIDDNFNNKHITDIVMRKLGLYIKKRLKLSRPEITDVKIKVRDTLPPIEVSAKVLDMSTSPASEHEVRGYINIDSFKEF